MECCLLAVQHPQSGVGGRGPRWLYSPGGDGKPLPWSDSQPLSHRGREEVGNHSPRTVSVCKWPDRIVFPSSRAVFSLVQWGFGNFGFWARFVLLLLTRVPSLMLVCGSCWPARQCGHRIPNDGAGGQARSLRVCHHECSRWKRGVSDGGEWRPHLSCTWGPPCVQLSVQFVAGCDSQHHKGGC